MSWDWNAIVRLSLGIILILAVVIFPLPGSSVETRPLQVGESVYLKRDRTGGPWKVAGFNRPRDTVILERGTDQALMAVWECVPAE